MIQFDKTSQLNTINGQIALPQLSAHRYDGIVGVGLEVVTTSSDLKSCQFNAKCSILLIAIHMQFTTFGFADCKGKLLFLTPDVTYNH